MTNWRGHPHELWSTFGGLFLSLLAALVGIPLLYMAAVLVVAAWRAL